jgi:hypothetical protein
MKEIIWKKKNKENGIKLKIKIKNEKIPKNKIK